MGGVSLVFHDFIDETKLTISLKDKEFICLYIDNEEEEQYGCIYLDRSTAIKFSKELRKQIALLD